ncbi:MAG: protein kinase [Planctomycetes bacterium]|nr:protein kinase [Planctomycetota bacterium]
MRVELVANTKSGKERVFVLEGHDIFLIGRSRNAHLPLRGDIGLSRHHCVIELAPPACVLRDLGSRNGTFLNGRRVEEARLREGDVIRIGGRKMIVRFPDGAPKDGTDMMEGASATYELGASEEIAEPRRAPAPSGTGEPAGVHAPEIPGYRTIRPLGRGNQGMVWLARRDDVGDQVALKFLLPATGANSRSADQFLREMEIHGRLVHPRIVRFLGGGTHLQIVYLVMEYVPGTDAEQFRKTCGGELDLSLACRICCLALEGLAHAHASGFVHRDVKPSNILVTEDGPDLTAKLNDFGLAKALGEVGSLTLSDEVKGSIPFMPPDQILHCRKPLPQYDVYSMGATLYRLLTGKFLYDFDGGKHRLAVILEDPMIPIRRWRTDVPAELERVIRTAVAKDLPDRYPDARFFLKALAPFAG